MRRPRPADPLSVRQAPRKEVLTEARCERMLTIRWRKPERRRSRHPQRPTTVRSVSTVNGNGRPAAAVAAASDGSLRGFDGTVERVGDRLSVIAPRGELDAYS